MTEEQLDTILANFARNWSDEPIVGRYDDTIVIRLYTIKRADNVVFQSGKRNTEDTICQRSDFFTMVFVDKNQLDELSKYVNLENLTLESKFRDFSKLQGIQKKFLSLTNILPPDYSRDETSIVDKSKFNNYLDHLNKVKKIKEKATKIVRDKFNVGDNAQEKVDTSAIFANVGYVVKGFEGKYISLSKGDRTFIKKFMDDQIKDGAYRITIKETLPLYRESIQEIIDLGKGLLKLTENKIQVKSYSRKRLGEERKTLESCWQLYFERYLQVMLMGYKDFYPQTVFKPMEGYDKETRPDFLAVDIYNNVDIIEIKHHRTTIFRKEDGRDSYYPSHNLTKAIFQLNKYLDLRSENIDYTKITNEQTRSIIQNSNFYRPRGLLIISSIDHITADRTDDEVSARLEKEIRKLKTAYSNIDVMLFDELIRNLENYVAYLDIYLGEK